MDRVFWTLSLLALAVLAACAKSEWTADEVVGEFRAYGLPTRRARSPGPNECPAAPAATAVRRFEADTAGHTGWGCIVEFTDAARASSAHAELQGSKGVGSASVRANVVLVLSADFEPAAASAYVVALQKMWGGE